jgi:hypothetical protein
MHPMFVKLFIEADADDWLAEQDDRRRRGRRSRRGRSVMTVRTATAARRDPGRRPRP